MSIQIEGVTSALLNKALDVSMHNHKVIANNVANVNTPDFKPLSVDFNAVMQEVRKSADAGLPDLEAITEIKNFELGSIASLDDSYPRVTLETEMVKMAENTLRYQALIDAKKSFGGMISMAINGGR